MWLLLSGLRSEDTEAAAEMSDELEEDEIEFIELARAKASKNSMKEIAQ